MASKDISNSLNGDGRISRRDFVKKATRTTISGALFAGLISADLQADESAGKNPNGSPEKSKAQAAKGPETRNQKDSMVYARLGKTNLLVSRLSLGGIPWQPAVARNAIAGGVNFVHGSNGYGTMAQQAKTLAKHWDDIWYFLKQETNGEKDMAKCLEKCLKTLGRDHVDMIMPGVYESGKTDYAKMLGDFEKLKKAGKVRFLGATVHTNKVPEVCKETIDTGIFDLVLTMYQPAVKQAVDKELAAAHARDLGVVSMKTIQGAAEADSGKVVAAAIAGGTIHTVLKGINNLGDLNAFRDAVRNAASPAAEAGADSQTSAAPGICGGCGNCRDCPQSVEVTEVARCESYYAAEPQLLAYAGRNYRHLAPNAAAGKCIECGRCEQLCPRNLPIRKMLQSANRRWA